MTFVVRRTPLIWDASPSEIEVLATIPHELALGLGHPWLEHIVVSSNGNTVELDSRKRITPASECDYWGEADADGGWLVLRRKALSSLWGDLWADYLLSAHPDAFLASSGGMWLRPDPWHVGETSELLSAEWLNTIAVTGSRDGRRVAFTARLPEAWKAGDVVVSILDRGTGAIARFGPFPLGTTDVISWSPAPDYLFLVLRDPSTNHDAAHVLNWSTGALHATSLPQGVQGFAWREDGSALAVAHTQPDAGITVVSESGGHHYSIGPCWSPVWLSENSLAVGTSIDNDPGDHVQVLQLPDGRLDPLLGPDWPHEHLAIDLRITGGRSPNTLAPGQWWADLLMDPTPAPTIDDLRAVSPLSDEQRSPELWCLFYDDPELYAAHERS